MTINNAPGGFDYAAALAACASGEAQALNRLYRQEAGRLLGVVLRIVRERQTAEDIVHDVFVTLWNKAHTFDSARGEARGWVYSIARHAALGHVRRHARTVSVDEETLVALEADERFDPSLEAAREAFRCEADLGQLAHCLQALDAPKRNSILYAYVDGCSHREIAERLNTPLGTVKAWIRRGLAALRECLA